MRMISGVVCYSNSDECWHGGVMKCSYKGVCYVIWNDFYGSYDGCDFDICESVTVTLICYVCDCPCGSVSRMTWCNALC